MTPDRYWVGSNLFYMEEVKRSVSVRAWSKEFDLSSNVVTLKGSNPFSRISVVIHTMNDNAFFLHIKL